MDNPGTLQLSYNWDYPYASAQLLLSTVFPQWRNSPNPVGLRQLTEDTANTLFKTASKPPGVGDGEDGDDAIVLHVYGPGTDVLVDRRREYYTHCLLAQHGLASPVLARFQNGLFYRLEPGRPCEPADMGREAVWRGVARRLGEWHAVVPATVTGSENGRLPSIWTVLRTWISILPEDTTPKSVLHIELQRLKERLGVTDGWNAEGMVLGHGDLRCGNVIIHPRAAGAGGVATVSFVDYEYALPCPAAFDLANHFSEWPGGAFDYRLLPSRAVRRDFLHEYTRSYTAHRGRQCSPREEDEIVATLERQVDVLRGVPGFFWGVCALVQATAFDIVIDFDAFKYAYMRFAEYWEWRADADSVRERQWAAEE
ncbi:kinase-like domain-containing protein [Sphaerosporella brunnea]|uniref:ethanolamine kinase n=1 Tax=Sphaerosporella brunnea TaxID=1250544 RepID=A0A5J5ENR5_9PEZI|nr:kinase-like domain-containing protein [Sphaerosporella brunnea]